ncbi:MAG: DNA polymerase [Bdellovibrionota bacterium]
MGKYLDIADSITQKSQGGTSTVVPEPLFSPVGTEITIKNTEAATVPDSGPQFRVNATLIQSIEQLHSWVSEIMSGAAPNVITIDSETTGLSFASDRICGIAIEVSGSAIYVPIGHEDERSNLPVNLVRSALSPLFMSDIPKLFHNATFDLPFLELGGFRVKGPYIDTRLMAKEIHRRELRSYGLKDLSCHHIHPRSNYWDEELDRLLKSKFRYGKKENLWRLHPSEVYSYATADVVLTRKLFDLFQKRISVSPISSEYIGLENQTIAVVTDLVSTGLKINEAELRLKISEMELKIAELSRDLDKELNVISVNYNSRQQVLPILKQRGITPINPENAKESICLDALEALDDEGSKSIQLLIEQVKIRNQLKQISGVTDLIRNGRVHSQITISAQLGERFSSTNPSLYTGKKKPEPGEVTSRHFIEPDDGYSLVFFDYSASHFRILAHLCGDEKMISIFQSGQDFHKGVASLMFGKQYEDVSKEERDRAKPIGFSVIYGAGYNSLSRNLKIPPSEAKRLKNQFLHKIFPKLGRYLDEVYRAVTIQGYVPSGLHGVKISVPKDHAYKGINYQIQVTEAEMLKRSLVSAHSLLQPFKSRVALPFHDEIVFQIHTDEFYLIPKIKAIIEDHALRVPIVCDVEVATRCWAEKEKWEPDFNSGTEWNGKKKGRAGAVLPMQSDKEGCAP